MQALHELTQTDASGERRTLESLPQFDPTFMKEGYLQKKGQMLKGWKQRWFVCDGRALFYFSHRRDTRPSSVIDLRYCIVEDGGRSETWNSVRIHLTDNATGTLYCLSSEDRPTAQEWLTVLRNAVSRLNRERRQRTTQPSIPAATAAAAVASAGGNNDKKRLTRMSSAPNATSVASPQLTSRPAPTKAPAAPRAQTTVALENELARDMEQLKNLLARRGGGAGGGAIVFSPLSAVNGVLKSLSSVETGKAYARGSVVLPVPSEVAAYYVCDHTKRADWDIHFPRSHHVVKFDEATELVHLTRGVQQIRSTKAFVSPQVAATVGAVVGGVIAFPSWGQLLNSMALFALIAVVVNSVDYSGLCAPRDLLLLRQVKKRKAKTGIDDDDDEVDHGQPIIVVLEKSVTNERKSEVSDVIRAHQGLGGWQLEPLDGGRTLVTYVTDIDTRGWLSAETKKDFMLQRLDCLAVLLEFVNQSQLSVAELGFVDDVDSGEDSDHGEVSAVTASGYSVDAGAGRGSTGFHPSDYYKGMDRLSAGGLKLTDKEVAKKQAGVLKDVLKSASATLLEGKGMVSLSLPVRIFEPRTNLERVIDLFLYGPTLLNVAADQTDPVERFKYVMAYAVAGLHHGVGQMKPFNPILGETYQTSLNDGTEVFCEHTSHHPPITNFELLGKKYTINGHIVWNPPAFSMKSSAFVQNNAGPIRVGFADGTVISYHLPLMQSGGFLWGDRTVELLGTIHFEDQKNGLVCDLKFHPDEKKGMGGMFSSSATPSDFTRGAIIKSATNETISSVNGSWLDGLNFDGKAYWTFGREQSGYVVPLPADKVLESDSRNREDLRYLAANDLDLAQEWKVKLEVLQRSDRKLRNDGRRPNHWTLKDGKHGH
ncbi:hypothetical protein Poli38472_006828 [Pythium oligandrum]|uniref:PH domain-containing protein n=1 Tax=Pythium oligandrum TaxID=41045 RepID=A0A8K1FFH7_PYTOL|nr:hypothetical protein Poli38472_006828 [Pythium oligandrum]|eukprot:TMW56818.1 hypothetical protein Poli38472_006828 [Pythium oligandrum]